MAKAIMIQGTASSAGKSLITAGLCRIFHQDGYKVAPFKSQNMALNSFITRDGYEMGRAQVMQAEAAGTEPDIRMNPILLKPTNDTGSQVIVNGEVVGNMSAADYFAYKHVLRDDVLRAYNSLASENDIIVIEGAGSPAEINLKSEDIVNMGMAKMAKAPVLIAGDIDRGGVFAALYGTIELLEKDERDIVRGVIINKFRGDESILRPGLDMLEQLTRVPVVGVVPYMQVDIDDEDSLAERLHDSAELGAIDIAVIKLPRISNFTDFNALSRYDGVRVRYVECERELGKPDLIILPGTKNTMGDLLWMRQNGLENATKKLAAAGTPIVGICGGYQMLGRELLDPDNIENGGKMLGMEILPVTTIFEHAKIRTRVCGEVHRAEGVFKALCGSKFEGYEIHMGRTQSAGECAEFAVINDGEQPRADGMACGNVFGSYVHGIFDEGDFACRVIECIAKNKGIDLAEIRCASYADYKQKQYDILADNLRKSLDMKQIYAILEAGI